MKNLLYILIALICFSCKKDSSPYKSEFETSLNKWNEYKASVNNSYIYSITSSSVWGPMSVTTIAVEKGIITLRSYAAYNVIGGNSTQVKTWTENATSLNTHNEGAAAITIDAIYAQAKAEWLSVDKNKNQISFTTDAHGIISSCGYVPNGCQDDCFTGVNIKSIDAL